jgi:succinate dehydrogenase/fumarate reductase cytochrome b subunit
MKQVSPGSRALPGWLWLIQAVTGVGLAVFVFIHLLDVATIILGVEFFNKFAHFLETGWFSVITRLVTWLVGIGLVVHALNGIRIASRPYLNAGLTWRHSRGIRHQGTWFWVFQVVTGGLIVFFASIHWFWIHAQDRAVVSFEKSIFRLSSNWQIAFYGFFLLFLLFHTMNGIRAVLLKTGFFTEKVKDARLTQAVLVVGAACLLLGLISLIMFRAHAGGAAGL